MRGLAFSSREAWLNQCLLLEDPLYSLPVVGYFQQDTEGFFCCPPVVSCLHQAVTEGFLCLCLLTSLYCLTPLSLLVLFPELQAEPALRRVLPFEDPLHRLPVVSRLHQNAPGGSLRLCIWAQFHPGCGLP